MMKALIRVYDKSKYESDSKIICEEEREVESVHVWSIPKETMASEYGAYEEDLDENDMYCQIFNDGYDKALRTYGAKPSEFISTFANSRVDVFVLHNDRR